MNIPTKHYQFTQKEVDKFNYKYESNWNEIHKYTFWFVSFDIDDDRNETYFDNFEEAQEEYFKVKKFLQTYKPILNLTHSLEKPLILRLMCHNVFKNEKGEDVFWKMNIRNEDYLEMDEEDIL